MVKLVPSYYTNCSGAVLMDDTHGGVIRDGLTSFDLPGGDTYKLCLAPRSIFSRRDDGSIRPSAKPTEDDFVFLPAVQVALTSEPPAAPPAAPPSPPPSPVPPTPHYPHGTGNGCEPTCCQAISAQCEACKACVGVDEYCAANPSVPGCAAIGLTPDDDDDDGGGWVMWVQERSGLLWWNATNETCANHSLRAALFPAVVATTHAFVAAAAPPWPVGGRRAAAISAPLALILLIWPLALEGELPRDHRWALAMLPLWVLGAALLLHAWLTACCVPRWRRSAAATALVDCRVTLVLLLRWLLYALVCVAVDIPEIAPEIEDRLTMLLPAGALLILLEVVHGCGVDARLRDPYIARELRASRCGHLIALIVNLALVALLLYAGIVLPLWSLWCGCALLFWVLVAAALLVWIHQLLLWCCEPRADEAAAAEPVTKATAALVHSAILSPNPGAGQVAPAGMTPPESRKTTAAKLLRRIVSQAVATQQPLEHVLATSFQQVDEGPEGDRGLPRHV